MTDNPPRTFKVAPSGEAQQMSAEESIRHMGVSAAMSAVYDILDDAGLANESRLSICLAAERNGGDAEAMARKIVRLAAALKGGAGD